MKSPAQCRKNELKCQWPIKIKKNMTPKRKQLLWAIELAAKQSNVVATDVEEAEEEVGVKTSQRAGQSNIHRNEYGRVEAACKALLRITTATTRQRWRKPRKPKEVNARRAGESVSRWSQNQQKDDWRQTEARWQELPRSKTNAANEYEEKLKTPTNAHTHPHWKRVRGEQQA